MSSDETVALGDIPDPSGFAHPSSPSRARVRPSEAGARTPGFLTGAAGTVWLDRERSEPPVKKKASPTGADEFMAVLHGEEDGDRDARPSETADEVPDAPATPKEKLRQPSTPTVQDSPAPSPPTRSASFQLTGSRVHRMWKAASRMVQRRDARSRSRTSRSPCRLNPEEIDAEAATRYLLQKVVHNKNKLLWSALHSLTTVTFMTVTALVLWFKDTPVGATGMKDMEVKATCNCYCPLDNGRTMSVTSTHQEKVDGGEKTEVPPGGQALGSKPTTQPGIPFGDMSDPNVLNAAMKLWVAGTVSVYGPYVLMGLGSMWVSLTVKTVVS